jgi:triphosphatase
MSSTEQGEGLGRDDREIELKLEIDSDSIDAVGLSDMLAGITPEDIDQVSTYYDTPRQDLRKARVSLRVRDMGTRHVQTIKLGAGASAGMFARPEWERDVSGAKPEIEDGSPLRTLIAETVLAKIVPAFTVNVMRRQWVIAQDDATIELVADKGWVSAGDRQTPVSEIELELKGGSPTALFALARVLDRDVPLRLGVLTKAERGYRLIEPAIMGAVKAERLDLTPDATAGEAFAEIVGACLRHFRLNENVLRRDRSPEALHQARVALRRLRSALSIFKPVVADSRFEHLAGELKWLAGLLGGARDLDVLLGRVGNEANATLLAAHDDAYAVALAALESRRTRALMIDLVEWATLGDWKAQPAYPEKTEQDVLLFADQTLTKLRRRLKRQGRDLDQLEDEARHRVRIVAKKLRYATGFFESLYTEKKARRRFAKFSARLEALQDHLGELNDLATAPALMARFGIDRDAAVSGDGRETMLADAADAHEALIEAKRFW